MNTSTGVEIMWLGKPYRGSDWESVLKHILADPRVDGWDEVMGRLNAVYGISLEPRRSFEVVIRELADKGILQIIHG
jgi:hypothetical protein